MTMAVVTADQIISLHSYRGAQLYQFPPQDYTDLTWTRERSDTSTCDITLPPLPGVDRLGDIAGWAHWITVWDGERNEVLWSGPIIKPSATRLTTIIEAKDHATYLQKTRVPMTKRWDATDPAWIAGELWNEMLDQKGIRGHAIVNADPEGERYDFQTKADEDMLDQTIGSLVDLGLKWSVVCGMPILGPLSLKPLTTLREDDFLGDAIKLVRDGSEVVNDVVIRTSDKIAQAQVGFHGLSLQGIKNIDEMSGASNAQRAAYTYLKQRGVIRTRLELDAGTVLHPNAPVSIDQLIPSARFVVECQGIRQLMELTKVEVSRRAGAVETKVTMEAALSTQELLDLELEFEKKQPDVSMPGATAR